MWQITLALFLIPCDVSAGEKSKSIAEMTDYCSRHSTKDSIHNQTFQRFTELAMKSEDGEAVISLRFGRLAEFTRHCHCVATWQFSCPAFISRYLFGCHFRQVGAFALPIKNVRSLDMLINASCVILTALFSVVVLETKPKSMMFLLLFVCVCFHLCLSNNF